MLQSLLLLLLSGAAALLPVIQPEGETFKTVAAAKLHVLALKNHSYSHFHNLWGEQLQRYGLLLLENQPSVSHGSTVDGLQDLLVKLLWQKATLKNKAERRLIAANRLWHRPVESLVPLGPSGVWKGVFLLAGG